jgi:succinate dehydrogenase / fumarate reductase cytochrome b subunit
MGGTYPKENPIVNWFAKTFTSVAGRKFIAALTGLGVVAFLIIHLIGNLQVFSDSNALNEYAKALHDGPLIVIGDVGLLIAFPLHIAAVLSLAIGNRRARGAQGYKVSGTKQKRGLAAVLASKTTLVGGLVLMAFVAAHVWHFRLRHEEIGYDVRGEIISELSNPMWGIFYIIGSLLVGWHLFHGFQAAFRSLGAWHPRYTPIITRVGAGLSILLALGFASIPAWILLKGGLS